MKKAAKWASDPEWFVTLTFPERYPDARKAKALLKRAAQRWERGFSLAGKRVACLWRLEFQGRGAPHFHLLLWTPDGLPAERDRDKLFSRMRRVRDEFRAANAAWSGRPTGREAERLFLVEWLSCIWAAVCRTDEDVAGSREESIAAHLVVGTDVRAVASSRQLTAYVSKYVAKVDADPATLPPGASVGRFWGIRNPGQWLRFKPVEVVHFQDVGLYMQCLERVCHASGQPFALTLIEEGRLCFYLFVPRETVPRVQASLWDTIGEHYERAVLEFD